MRSAGLFQKTKVAQQNPADLEQHEWVVYKMTSGAIKMTKGGHSYSVLVKGGISNQ